MYRRIYTLVLTILFVFTPYLPFITHEFAHAIQVEHNANDHPDLHLHDLDLVVIQKQVSSFSQFPQFTSDFEQASEQIGVVAFAYNVWKHAPPKIHICSYYYAHPSQAPLA